MSRARASATGDFGLIRDGLAAVVRWAPLILAVAIGSAATTQFVLNRSADDSRAVARVGLTNEVEWPFYDVVRDGVATLAETDDVRATVRDEIGSEFVAYSVDIPVALAAVDLVVTARSSEAADRGAVAAAEDVVERNLASRRATAQSEVDLLNDMMASAQRDATAKATVVDELIESYEDETDEIAILKIDEALRAAAIERDAATRAANDAMASVAEMQRRLVGVGAEVELVRLEMASESEVSSAVIGAVGIAAAMLASLIVTIASRERGRVRSAEQVRSVVGVDVISLDDSDAALLLPRKLLAGGERSAAVVGVAGGDESSLERLIEVIESAGMKVNDQVGIKVVDLEGSPVDGAPASVVVTSAVVIAQRRRSHIGDVKSRVAALEASGIPVAGVVLENP